MVNVIEVNGKTVVFVDIYPEKEKDEEIPMEFSCAIFDKDGARLDQ